MSDTKYFLNQNEVAEILGTNIQTVTNMRKTDVLPFVKVGKQYLTTQDCLKNFFNAYQGLDCSNEYEMKKSYEIVNYER